MFADGLVLTLFVGWQKPDETERVQKENSNPWPYPLDKPPFFRSHTSGLLWAR
jgi:hypothetical protein